MFCLHAHPVVASAGVEGVSHARFVFYPLPAWQIKHFDGVAFGAFVVWEVLPTCFVLFFFWSVPQTRLGFCQACWHFLGGSGDEDASLASPMLTGVASASGAQVLPSSYSSHAWKDASVGGGGGGEGPAEPDGIGGVSTIRRTSLLGSLGANASTGSYNPLHANYMPPAAHLPWQQQTRHQFLASTWATLPDPSPTGGLLSPPVGPMAGAPPATPHPGWGFGYGSATTGVGGGGVGGGEHYTLPAVGYDSD